MYLDRKETARRLAQAASGAVPVSVLIDWIRAQMIGAPLHFEPLDASLLQHLVARLDVVQDDERRLLALATSFSKLLASVISNETAERLLEVVADRDRTVGLIEKYQQRKISRVQFLSFVAEQRWPAVVRRDLRNMPDDALADLKDALSREEYRSVASLIGSASGEAHM